MHSFDIRPANRSAPQHQIMSVDPSSVLHVMSQFDLDEADIYCDGDYAFSLRTGKPSMFWTIYLRDGAAPPLA